MISEKLGKIIESHKDFPIPGIIFRDILPVLRYPEIFNELIENMSKNPNWEKTEALVAIDARGFIFGSCIANKLSKPMITARKAGKLPGKLLDGHYSYEYGKNSLAIQSRSIEKFNNFAIVDDLLATGETVKCVKNILESANKKVTLLSVVIELKALSARESFKFPVDSQIIY
jgi:adenine phosphoribosyltransferase